MFSLLRCEVFECNHAVIIGIGLLNKLIYITIMDLKVEILIKRLFNIMQTDQAFLSKIK